MSVQPRKQKKLRKSKKFNLTRPEDDFEGKKRRQESYIEIVSERAGPIPGAAGELGTCHGDEVLHDLLVGQRDAELRRPHLPPRLLFDLSTGSGPQRSRHGTSDMPRDLQRNPGTGRLLGLLAMISPLLWSARPVSLRILGLGPAGDAYHEPRASR